jgi:DnaJ-class molecular chaperone
MKAKLPKLRFVKCETCDGSGEVAASMNQMACDIETCKACKGIGKVPQGKI